MHMISGTAFMTYLASLTTSFLKRHSIQKCILNGRFAFVFGLSDFDCFLTFFDDLGFLRIDLGFICDYLNVVATGNVRHETSCKSVVERRYVVRKRY